MAPTLILVRHAQALHNAKNNEYHIPDPELSELGLQQCEELHNHLQELPLANQVELIVVSPMRRTLQTATIGLDWLIQRGVRVLPDARWQENSDKPCDTGSSIQAISVEFPNIDFSSVDPVYPEKIHPPSNPYAFTRKAVLARGQDCLRTLYHRSERVIAVVSHSGFLRCAISHTRYGNADYRIFDFVNPSGDEGEVVYELKEWGITEKKGGGMGKSEKGRAEVEPRDFPSEDQPDEVAEGVEQDLGEKAQGEAAREVPK